MFQKNASKFAIVYSFENPCFVFIFILSNFIFSLLNALIFVDTELGNHKGKSNVTWNVKWKKQYGISYT